MDKYVGTDVGIYHVESVCEQKDTDGHKLYHVKCKYCEYESDMRLFNIKQATICKHKNRMGRLLEFKSYWSCPRLRNIFKSMQDRCLNSNNKNYRWYGAKGIGIYKEWLDNPKIFEEWALSNGYSDELTIDRIDSDKDYCPENCRWVTIEENSRKAGRVNWITVNNITLTGKQWAKELGVGINAINRIIRSYGIEKARDLIEAMIQDPPSTKHRNNNQTWLSVYDL